MPARGAGAGATKRRARRPGTQDSRTAMEGPDSDLSAAWLVRLRWGALVAQLVVVLGVHAWGIQTVPLGLLLGLLGVGVLSNLALARPGRPRWAVRAALVLDTVLLTGMLLPTGGASNPFSVLYLVHVALAAVMLGPGWTWGIAALSVCCFAFLFLFPDPHAMHHDAAAMEAHLWGMWLAFTLAGAAIATFVARLASALRARETALELARADAERAHRLGALTTLAAGAAHEMGTPVNTITLAAAELEHRLRSQGDPVGADDARLIRAQAERCGDILRRMSAHGGEVAGELAEDVDVADLVAEAGRNLAPEDAARVDWPAGPARIRAPWRGLALMLAGLVRNAIAAAPAPARVEVRVQPLDGGVSVEVVDAGVGMPAEVLARAGEPFFTTRPAGGGMGLGLFLARRFAEAHGGRLELRSTPGRGTTARIHLPARS